MKLAFFKENLDDLPYKILEDILEEDYRLNFSNYSEFYDLKGEIEKNIFTLYLHPINTREKIYIATYDLETKKILDHIDKNQLKKILFEENEKLESYKRQELERSSKIIISIIGLILGLIITYIVLKLINGGF
ncbi:MAG: hypothetical protein ACPLXN_04845 [Sulfurihydrogenibium sp.]|uniref:hypothetical protein n=1 Tax=Sulfurihydrogenibium sp. TaxID=2053621 RepID=UPI000CC5D51B|nr:MAG: hypothetical protein C0198_03040 [Sulfurihydrogenibium sp.]